MLCLANDADDLRARIDRLLVGFTYDGEPVTAKSLRPPAPCWRCCATPCGPTWCRPARGCRRWCTAARSPTSPTAATAWSPPAWRCTRRLGDHRGRLRLRSRRREVLRHQVPDGGARHPRGRAGGDGAGAQAARRRGAEELTLDEPTRRRCARPAEPGEARREHRPLRRAAGGGAEPLRRRHRRGDRRGGRALRRPGRALRGLRPLRAGRRGGARSGPRGPGAGGGPAGPVPPALRARAPFPDKVLAIASRMYGARGVVLTREAERDLREVRRLGSSPCPSASPRRPPRSRTTRSSAGARATSTSRCAASGSRPAPASWWR
jgi:hypothetical protein